MNLRRLQLSFRRQNGDMIFRKQNSHDLLKPKMACGTDSALDGMFKAVVETVQLRRDSPTNNDVDESIVVEFWDGFGEVLGLMDYICANGITVAAISWSPHAVEGH